MSLLIYIELSNEPNMTKEMYISFKNFLICLYMYGLLVIDKDIYHYNMLIFRYAYIKREF